jgi:alpha-N-acetylglucosamine transferase
VEDITTPIRPDDEDNTASPCHARTCDGSWTKLRLFELEGYDTILYVDSDCLILKDIGHLLHIGDPATPSEETVKRVGLLAAAPDTSRPDKFDAGVMLLRPSASVYAKMTSRLGRIPTFEHNSRDPVRGLPISSSKPDILTFLNDYYPGWHSDMPSYSRLSVAYNAPPLMYGQPKNEGVEIDDICIIRFGSSPRPWERNTDTSNCRTNDVPESMWRAAHEKSKQYHADSSKEEASDVPNEGHEQNLPRRRRRHPTRRDRKTSMA